MHGLGIAGQQVRGGPDLADVLGGVPVTDVVARQVQPEPFPPAVRLHTCSVPAMSATCASCSRALCGAQPADAVGAGRGLRASSVGSTRMLR